MVENKKYGTSSLEKTLNVLFAAGSVGNINTSSRPRSKEDEKNRSGRYQSGTLCAKVFLSCGSRREFLFLFLGRTRPRRVLAILTGDAPCFGD